MNTVDNAVSSLLAAQQASLGSKISFAVAAKQLDAQEAAGEAALRLLEDAVQLSKEVGKGANVDKLA